MRLDDFQQSEGLRESSRAHSARRESRRFRGALVISQIAMALLLSMGASLLIRSFDSLMRVDLGFRPDNVLAFSVPLFTYRSGEARIHFAEQVLEKVRAMPGVRSAGLSNRIPLGGDNMASSIDIEGRVSPPNAADIPQAHARSITPGYFEALGVDLESGRFPTDSDNAHAVPAIWINEAAARAFWPGQEPLGKRLKIAGKDLSAVALNGAPEPWLTVLGVVRNVKHDSLTAESRPEIFLPFAQRPWIMTTFVVRSSAQPEYLDDCDHSGGSLGKQRSAGDPHTHDVEGGCRFGGSTAVSCDPARRICRVGAGAGRCRRVRSHILFRRCKGRVRSDCVSPWEPAAGRSCI